MGQEDIPLDLSGLERRTEEQAELIRKVLEAVKPIQTRLVGERAVRAVARGASFETIEGGRHLNFTEAVSLLSNIAQITQIAVLAVLALRKLRADAARRAEEKEAAKRLVADKIAAHPELAALSGLLASDPSILDRIVEKVTAETAAAPQNE